MTATTLRRPVALSTAGTALARLSGAIGGLFAARLLGPTGRGEYALLVLAGTAVGTIGTGGLQFWATRELGGGRSSFIRGAITHHARRMIAWLVAAAALAVFLGAPASLVIATAAFAAAWTVSTLWLAVPNGQLAMGLVAAATTTGGALFIALMLGLEISGTTSVALVVGAAALANAGVIPIAHRRVRLLQPGGPYPTAIAEGRAPLVSELVTLAMFRIDVALVAVFVNARAAGLYAVATALSELLWLLPDGVTLVVLPAASGSHRDEVRRLVTVTAVATAVAAVLLTAIARSLLTALFGSAYASASAAVPALGLAAVAIGVWKMVSADAVATGAGRVRATSSVVGLAVMLAADVVLVPVFGISGAAAGAALGYGAAAAYVLRWWTA